MKKNTFFILFTLLLLSCQSMDKRPRPSDLSKKQLNSMDEALVFIKEGAFLKAARIYDQLSKEVSGKSVEAMMLFNSGSSYRNAGECARSVDRYRRMLDKSLKQNSFKVRGLIEISYSYECLGDFQASYLSLKDAGHLRSHLPDEFNKMIYPARLSLAYARLGQKAKADNYKSFALTGVLQSRTQYSSEIIMNTDLSRIFYFMGKSYMIKKTLNPEVFFRGFAYHQVYLLQSFFLRDKKWSLESKKELEHLFNHLQHLLSLKDNKKNIKYKKLIQSTLTEGQKMVDLEKSQNLKSFYKENAQKILSLLKGIK